jgi:peptidoglycan/LPS O-acetylase OafA/YrhL
MEEVDLDAVKRASVLRQRILAPGSRRTLGQALDENGGIGAGFNLIRLAAAFAVLIGHSFAMTGHGEWEPFGWFSGGQTDMGGTATYLFFLISGFLVTQSLQHSQSVTDYACKRAGRIMPGLVTVVVLLAFFFGPMLTRLSLPEYFAADGFLSFFRMIIFAGNASLPGIENSVDAPLWTLRYEALCYTGLAAAGVAGLLAPRRMLLVVAGLLAVAGWWAKNRHLVVLRPFDIDLGYLLRFLGYFVAGVAFYVFRARILLDARAGLVALVLAILFLRFGCYHLFFPLLGGYLVLLLGMRTGAVARFFQHRDYSYGVYIYAWPVQLTVIQMLGSAGAWLTATLWCMAVTLVLAALSWHFVERPALMLVRSRRLGRSGTPARVDHLQAGATPSLPNPSGRA